ncbi:MAG: glutathione-disulfide reductase [Rhizobiaceae bacterium]
MSQYDYDLFVIGGGSGGVRSARIAASLGKKVAIAEEFRYGGTCVIRGCVPKKLLVYASHFATDFEAARGFGWDVGDCKFDWATLIGSKDEEINRLEGLYQKGLTNAGAQMFHTRAVLEGKHEIRLLDEDRVVTAERIIIAVGGTPNRLEHMSGWEHCITSDEVFDLKELPKNVVVQGGGYIAVEFACIFAGLGANTTLVYRGEEILRGFDMDVRTLLHEEMTNRGIHVVCGQTIEKVESTDDGSMVVFLSDGEEIPVDQVLRATGRIALTKNLGLEKAGVELADNGSIKVDAYSKTNVDNIWALGDVTDRVALTPVAIHEAMCFIDTEYRGIPTSPDHDLIATAVFSQPEIGTIGLSEEQAAEKYPELDIYRAHFRPMKNTLSGSTEKMLMKIIADSKTGTVVGIHIMGDGAGEMVQSLGVAIKMGATKEDFDRTMAVHPTAAEELVTMYQPSYRMVNGKRTD